MSELKHIVEFIAGHDCIKFECKFKSKDCVPGGGGSHGRHGLTLIFASKGPEGAVAFQIYTGWMPQKVQKNRIGFMDIRSWGSDTMPSDLGYHSKSPRYEGHTQTRDKCEYCDGEPCYYDGSSLNSHDAMYALVNGGEDALWKFMDDYYNATFHDEEYPAPAEYPMPLRKQT